MPAPGLHPPRAHTDSSHQSPKLTLLGACAISALEGPGSPEWDRTDATVNTGKDPEIPKNHTFRTNVPMVRSWASALCDRGVSLTLCCHLI